MPMTLIVLVSLVCKLVLLVSLIRMPKKVYDIKPPKVAYKLEKTIKDMEVSRTKKSQNKADAPVVKKRFPLKELLIGGALLVILISIALYIRLPKAQIQIWPRTENLILQDRVTFDKSINEVDLSGKIIPVKYLEEEKSGSKEFLSTGTSSQEVKASGTITIYNKADPPAPLTLIKGTHFLSDSGKYFVTLDKVTIPSAKYEKGMLVSGSINVKVQAKETGDEFNIGPSKFSVPKLSGTSYYYAVFAESNSQMAGGYKGVLKKVTADDISMAKEFLGKELLSKAESSLKSKLSEDDVLLDKAILKSDISVEFDAKEGSLVDKFNGDVKVKVSALVFKKKDVEKFTKESIISQLPSYKDFLEESLSINYEAVSIDVERGEGIIDLQSSVKTYYSINTNDLIDYLSSKSADQIDDIFYDEYGSAISDLKVNFWPFWVNKTPANKNRIEINLNFD